MNYDSRTAFNPNSLRLFRAWLFGTQGDTISPGKKVRAVQRFTPEPKGDERGMTFIKLGSAYGGWVLLMENKGMVGLVPANR